MQHEKIKPSPFSWLKQGGHPLPKKLLRPFLFPPYHSLDDRRLVFVDDGDSMWWPHAGMQFSFLIAFIAGLGSVALQFEETPPILVTIIFTGLGFWFRHMWKNSEPSSFNIFDREKGTFSFHIPSLLGIVEVLEAPWSEFEGRLVRGATRHGESRHNLILYHVPTVRGYIVDDSIMGIGPLLSEWSFLVQYMDKDGPLPDIPPLEQYPNRTVGIGTHLEWENRSTHNQPDPYYLWLDEVEKNPELDVLNHSIKERKKKRSS